MKSELIYKLNKTDNDVNELLSQNKNLVYYMLGTMHLIGDQDCESAAYEALWDAVNCFDVFSTVPFADYACTCIKNAINDTLRKRQAQKRSLYVAVELTDDINLFYTDEVCSAETFSKVDQLFDRYINYHITGSLARNVLLVWYSSKFEMAASEIAKQCNTSPSYVCRVQCAFRAYLGNQLKE